MADDLINVLVIGGTGSLGESLLPKLVADPTIGRIRVMSRNEHRQIWMHEELQSPKIDWFLGDVRDEKRVWLATRGVHTVFHLAAIKSIDKAEYNPNEAILTNIEGTRNVIDACIKNGVSKAVFTSTDKAADPYNIYGASKLVAEKLWIQSNNYSTRHGTNFIAVRYGNVLGSNGSVLQKWFKSAQEKNEIRITNSEMTRFWMTLDAASELVLRAARLDERYVTMIPLLKGATMAFFARCFCETVLEHLGPVKILPMPPRGGEKMHETLISDNERTQCLLQNDKETVHRYGDDIPVHSIAVKRYSSDQAESWYMDQMLPEMKKVIYGE